MDDLIKRSEAIDAIRQWVKMNQYYHPFSKGKTIPVDEAIDQLERVQAEQPSSQQWRVIEKRPMTEDERNEWSERLGYDIEYEEAYIYSNLPDDGQEVLVSTQYGRVYADTFRDDEGCYFEENGDMDGIVAWMPKPEPYKGAET